METTDTKQNLDLAMIQKLILSLLTKFVFRQAKFINFQKTKYLQNTLSSSLKFLRLK